MIYKVTLGTKIKISENCNNWSEYKGVIFEVLNFKDYDEMIELYTQELNNPKFVFNGIFHKKDFDYYGNHVNNEIIELVSKHDIKSFQAVLDDGRIINYSCLN